VDENHFSVSKMVSRSSNEIENLILFTSRKCDYYNATLKIHANVVTLGKVCFCHNKHVHRDLQASCKIHEKFNIKE
jgi:hypothetical protein